MKRVLKKILLIITIMFALVTCVPVYAELDDGILNDSNANVCEDEKVPEKLKEAAGCNTTKTLPGVSITIIQAVLGLLSIVAVGVMVFGAVTYSTSTGDPGKSHKGQMTLLYGFVGLVICLMAFAIVAFVIEGVFA